MINDSLDDDPHVKRAEELLAAAEAWLEDEDSLGERGYGIAQLWIDLAHLHLALHDAGK